MKYARPYGRQRNSSYGKNQRLSTAFTPASKFYSGEPADDDRLDEDDGPAFAHAIVWFDQKTPIYVCSSCHGHIHTLEWAGDGDREDYDVFRAEAFQKLIDEDPRCDVCSNQLAEKIEK